MSGGILVVYVVFFFFQAEDGIRDYKVTGVQTCALPISLAHPFRAQGCDGQRLDRRDAVAVAPRPVADRGDELSVRRRRDRKSTRLNSSHLVISYAVFCLKKKKTILTP